MLINDSDFLTTQEIADIKNKLIGDQTPCSWVLSDGTNKKASSSISNQIEDSWQMVHVAMMDGKELSPLIEDFRFIFNKFINKHQIRSYMMLRAKSNLVPQDKLATGKYHYPHIDSEHKHFVFLYYVNDSDGDTILFDKMLGDDISDMRIESRVSPKAGTAILFDGHQYHSSSSPVISKYRCVININFVGRI